MHPATFMIRVAIVLSGMSARSYPDVGWRPWIPLDIWEFLFPKSEPSWNVANRHVACEGACEHAFIITRRTCHL